MPRNLTIARKLLSLKDRIRLTDLDDRTLYESTWHFGFPFVSWSIVSDGVEVARLRRKFAWFRSVWSVSSGDQRFELRSPLFSWGRRVSVVGGPFDGAELEGSLFDMSFVIRYAGNVVARAVTKLITVRDRHNIEVLQDTDAAELLTAILMVQLMVKNAEREQSSASSNNE